TSTWTRSSAASTTSRPAISRPPGTTSGAAGWGPNERPSRQDLALRAGGSRDRDPRQAGGQLEGGAVERRGAYLRLRGGDAHRGLEALPEERLPLRRRGRHGRPRRSLLRVPGGLRTQLLQDPVLRPRPPPSAEHVVHE